MSLRVFVVALAVVVAAAAARAEILFEGVIVLSGKTLFALSETSGRASGWIELGHSFADHTLKDYDAQTDVLTLERGKEQMRIRLKDARIREARFDLSGTLRFGHGETVQVVRATMMFGQEIVFPLGDSALCRMTATRRPDGTILYRTSFEQRGADGTWKKIAAPAAVVLPDKPFSLSMGEFSYGFEPK